MAKTILCKNKQTLSIHIKFRSSDVGSFILDVLLTFLQHFVKLFQSL
jgi:hypothetical protein